MRKCIGAYLDIVAEGYHEALFRLDFVRVLFVFEDPSSEFSKFVDISDG